jgi:hypothetical protein
MRPAPNAAAGLPGGPTRPEPAHRVDGGGRIARPNGRSILAGHEPTGRSTELAITIEVRDGVAYISFPLDNDEGLSSSGKTRIVASTHGNQQIGDTGVFMGLNAYRPVKKG